MFKESPLDQALHLAALNGDVIQLRKMLDTGRVHVDCRDQEKTTPLMLAAANNHLECVIELLEQGANPAARRETGSTALFLAAQAGYLAIVRTLLDYNAPIDIPNNDGGTALMVTCQAGHMEVVKMLVEKGANIHATMRDRATPLFLASQNGHLKVCLFLLSRGANVNARRIDNATPLWIASQLGTLHIVQALLMAGARVDCCRHDGASPLFKAASKGHQAIAEEILKKKPCLGILPNGETALHAAAMVGNLPMTQLLVRAGSDPNLQNRDGQTALDVAYEYSHWPLVEYLQPKTKLPSNGALTRARKTVSSSQSAHSLLTTVTPSRGSPRLRTWISSQQNRTGAALTKAESVDGTGAPRRNSANFEGVVGTPTTCSRYTVHATVTPSRLYVNGGVRSSIKRTVTFPVQQASIYATPTRTNASVGNGSVHAV